jgi:hypothetical protein
LAGSKNCGFNTSVFPKTKYFHSIEKRDPDLFFPKLRNARKKAPPNLLACLIRRRPIFCVDSRWRIRESKRQADRNEEKTGTADTGIIDLVNMTILE